MRSNLFTIATILVIATALFLRLWRISSYPVSLSMDEAAVAYNAKSILDTGKDEFGKILPLSFRSVGDYKTPTAIYLTAGSIALFGQSEIAVRFPAVFFGALSALVFIFLLAEVGFSRKASVFGGFWFAMSPWHIFLSRTSFDGVIALFFLILGLLVFLRSNRNKSTFMLSVSVSFLALSAWSYHAERVFVPILAVFLLIYFKPKKLLVPGIVGTVFLLPFIYALISGQGVLGRAGDLWVGKDINTTWVQQYLNYFDLQLWFAKGLNFTPPGFFDVGFLYYLDFPLFVLGVYALTKSKNKFTKKLTIFWFFAGPLAGSLTRGGINPGRTLIWLPFFGLVMTSAFEYVFSKYKNWKFVLVIYLMISIWNLGFFFDMFTRNFPKYYADLWHYGYKEVAQYACENHAKYEKIIITDKYGIEWPSVKTIPYLYILVYCNWDPAKYLVDKNLYNIEFRQPQWRIDSKEKNYLLIGSRWDFPEDFDKSRIMKVIMFPGVDKAAFYFVETTNQK